MADLTPDKLPKATGATQIDDSAISDESDSSQVCILIDSDRNTTIQTGSLNFSQAFALSVYGQSGWDLDLVAGIPENPGDDGLTLLLSTQPLNNQNGDAGSGGAVQATPAAGGDVDTGNGDGGQGGLVVLQPGVGGSNINGVGDGGDGGDIYMTLPAAGSGHGGGVGGRQGLLILLNFPIDDPLVAGAVWLDSGVLTVSAGPPP